MKKRSPIGIVKTPKGAVLRCKSGNAVVTTLTGFSAIETIDRRLLKKVLAGSIDRPIDKDKRLLRRASIQLELSSVTGRISNKRVPGDYVLEMGPHDISFSGFLTRKGLVAFLNPSGKPEIRRDVR